MLGFTSQAQLIPLSKAEIERRSLPMRWQGEFISDLVCVSAFCGTVTIPKGFVTDDASIPKGLWNVLSNTDPNISYPAFAHDFLYSVHGCLPDRTVTKDQCDQLLREQMKLIGAPQWQYDQVYWAVRMFGGGAFRSKLVGIKKPWTQETHPAKLAKTPYAMRPQVRWP